ncbi:MAG: Csp1 family four helix bundle copper storage protein [Nannocystaceae bacterium]
MRRREFIVGNSAVLTACTNDDIAAPRIVVEPVKPKPKPKPKPKVEPEAAADAHAGHAGHALDASASAVVDVALACVDKGRRCQAHCHALLGQGDTSMLECTKAVTDMIAVADALAALAAAQSPSFKAQAGVAREVCGRCQEACQVHADTHATCRACAEACGAALAAFQTLLG